MRRLSLQPNHRIAKRKSAVTSNTIVQYRHQILPVLSANTRPYLVA
jgi:hypothetical protein